MLDLLPVDLLPDRRTFLVVADYLAFIVAEEPRAALQRRQRGSDRQSFHHAVHDTSSVKPRSEDRRHYGRRSVAGYDAPVAIAGKVLGNFLARTQRVLRSIPMSAPSCSGAARSALLSPAWTILPRSRTMVRSVAASASRACCSTNRIARSSSRFSQ